MTEKQNRKLNTFILVIFSTPTASFSKVFFFFSQRFENKPMRSFRLEKRNERKKKREGERERASKKAIEV